MRSPAATRNVTAASSTLAPTLISTSVAVITQDCLSRKEKQRVEAASDENRG